MEAFAERTQRTFIKLSLGALVGVILIVAIFWGGHDVYVRWQERRLVRRAVAALEQRDFRNASLAARTVLELKPASVGASRVMAEITEQTADRGALSWRRKVAELEPNSLENILAWARCALRFNDVATAERVLGQAAEAGKQNAGYHAVAALVAQARGQVEKARQEWSEAVRLAPESKYYQLQLGISQVRARDPAQNAAGQATLRSLRNDPEQRSAATRALISDGIARRANARELLKLAHDLQAYPEATFSDRIVYAAFLREVQDPRFSAYLTELEQKSAANATELAALLSWMSQNNLNLLALDFFKSLPAETVKQWPVPPTVAEVYARLKEWRKLEEATKAADWRTSEFLRHAYLALALRGQDKMAAGEGEWAAAVKAASGQAEALLALVRAASTWNWEKEAVDLVWTLAKNVEKQREALETLYSHYIATGDTHGLYRVLLRLAELDSSNLDIRNNLAQTGLLLNANVEEARRMAAEVYHAKPANSAYATTYAFSLMNRGDLKGAENIMNSLGEEQRREPAISAYYGILLAATGQKEKARPFLEEGQKAKLLPEEKALLEKARTTLGLASKGQ